jgi:dTMP kinase
MLRSLQNWATQGLTPHHTILLDCSLDTAAERLQVKNSSPDRIESEKRAFHARVRQGYLELARRDPARFVILDADRPLESVLLQLRTAFWDPIMAEYDHGS